MLHLKWDILRNKDLLVGLDKIRECTRIDPVAGYRAGRVTEKMVQEQKKANNENIKLLKVYAEKDKDGNLIPAQDGYFRFATTELKEKYEVEFNKFTDTPFSIAAEKIDFSTLKECQLSPAEITALVDSGIVTEPS